MVLLNVIELERLNASSAPFEIATAPVDVIDTRHSTSIYGLYFRDQAESAFTVFTLPQYLLFGTALIALLLGLWAAQLTTLFALNVPITLFFVTVVAFRTVVGVSGAAAETTVTITDITDHIHNTHQLITTGHRDAVGSRLPGF